MSNGLQKYFEKNSGSGMLSTADADGRVNAAVFARPHVLEDGTLTMIMADRLSRANLEQNPHAAYLFREDGPGWKGKRFHLTRIRDEQDPERIRALRRRTYSPDDEARIGELHLVTFRIDKELPLVGPEVDEQD